jgi:hypothetical protein
MLTVTILNSEMILIRNSRIDFALQVFAIPLATQRTIATLATLKVAYLSDRCVDVEAT